MVSKESPNFTDISEDAEDSPRINTMEMASQSIDGMKPVEISSRTGKPKRRKAARACTNCQRTHLTCDDDRPCERCVKRGCASTCVDGERKKSKRTRGSTSSASGIENPDLARVLPEILSQRTPSMDLSHPPLHEHHQIQLLQSPPIHSPHFPHPHSYPHQHSSSVLSHISKYSPTRPGDQAPRSMSDDYSNLSHEYQRSGGHLMRGHTETEQPHPASLDAFDLRPDFFEPLDSYPLPSHPTLNGFTREIGRVGAKDGSVITSMLHERYSNGNSMGKPGVANDIGQYSRFATPYTGIRGPQGEAAGVVEEGVLPWLEPPTNPLANAHDDVSRHFAYRYEPNDVSEVYRRVTEPHPHRKSFHKMVEYLKENLTASEFKQIADILTKLKSQFYNAMKSLSYEDNLFVEQSFQRSLLEEEKQFALTAVPGLVWRRSGLVAAVSPRFTKLAQWTPDQLKSKFVMRAMNNESIYRYFQKLQPALLPGSPPEFKFECILRTPSGEEIPTEAEITIKMDIFNVPLAIIGKFWVQQR